jgi:hypothetical protein
MNTVTTFEPTMEAVTSTDDSLPYVLVSSLLGSLVSLASVWAWTATTLGPVIQAVASALSASVRKVPTSRFYAISAPVPC